MYQALDPLQSRLIHLEPSHFFFLHGRMAIPTKCNCDIGAVNLGKYGRG